MPPERCYVGRSQRIASHTPRRGKLTVGQQSLIRVLAQSKTLRELAADFGVSHETIRTVVREQDSRCIR